LGDISLNGFGNEPVKNLKRVNHFNEHKEAHEHKTRDTSENSLHRVIEIF